MRIAVDARELHQPVGKGRYITELLFSLSRIDTKNEYLLYGTPTTDFPNHFQWVATSSLGRPLQKSIPRDAQKRGADLLFLPTAYMPAIFSSLPIVVTIHDLALFLTQQARPSLKTLIAERLFAPRAARRAARIVAVSQSTKNDLHRLWHIPETIIDVTPLGYNRERFSPIANPADNSVLNSLNLKPNYLLFIGTLEPRKNVVGLLHAYAALPPEVRKNYPLVIGGKNGWNFEEIYQTATKLNLSSEIRFLGPVKDEQLPALYRNAAVFVFPSFYEGFGLPVLEALASGTPVIVANNSSLPEVVGNAGLTINPHDTSTVTSALTKYLEDPALQQSLRQAAPLQAQKFSWENTARTTLAAFEQAHQSHRS